MSGVSGLAARVNGVCNASEPDSMKKQSVGDALRNDPEIGKDMWRCFQPHVSSTDDKERWLAIDCLHDCLRSAMPSVPKGDIESMERGATNIKNGKSSGRDKEAAESFLGDTSLWKELKSKASAGGGTPDSSAGAAGHGKPGHGDGGRPGEHGMGSGTGKFGGEHGKDDDDDKHGKFGGKHGKDDDDDKHGKFGGKHGKDDDDDKHGKFGGKHGKDDDDDKHGRKGDKDDDDDKGKKDKLSEKFGKLGAKLDGKEDDDDDGKHGRKGDKDDDDKHGHKGADAQVHVSGAGGKHGHDEGGRRHEQEAGGHGGRHGDKH